MGMQVKHLEFAGKYFQIRRALVKQGEFAFILTRPRSA